MTTVESTGSGNWSGGGIWSGGVARAGDAHDVIIKDGDNVTISQDESANSVTIEDNATLTISGTRTITIDDKDGSSYSFRAISGSTISGTLNIKVTGNGGYISEQATGSINNLEVDLGSSSDVHYLDVDLSIGGNLTITEGIFNTNGSSNRALTVAGTTTIGDGSASATEATLTCNDSLCSFGSGVTSGYAVIIEVGGFFNGGTGTHTMGSFKIGADNALAKATLSQGVTTIDSEVTGENKAFRIAGSSAGFDDGNGTVKFTTPASTTLQLNTKPLYNVIIDHASCVLKWIDNVTIAKDLNIYQGTFEADDGDETLTVTEDVIVGDGTGSAAVLGHADDTADMTFGSLTINSDGTYKATSGTTTITSKTSDNFGIKGGGTFTHNNGEVKVTGNAFNFPIGATYYDFTWDTSSEPCILSSTTLSGGATIDGTQNAGYTAILGTLKINDRGFAPYNATKVFVNNLIIGDNTDSANATTFDMQYSDAFDGDVIVNNILINADGQLKFGDNHAGNSDALEVRGAFRSLGGASGVVVV